MEVLITVWGTPKWANGGKKPNYMPTKLSDLTNFTRALAGALLRPVRGIARSCASGRLERVEPAALPRAAVRLEGASVGPRNYARLYAAAYAGIKAGSARAMVAIGETSAHGRDRQIAGVTGTHSPGRFAQLVATANPRLKFDAWAHHPYPVPSI